MVWFSLPPQYLLKRGNEGKKCWKINCKITSRSTQNRNGFKYNNSTDCNMEPCHLMSRKHCLQESRIPTKWYKWTCSSRFTDQIFHAFLLLSSTETLTPFPTIAYLETSVQCDSRSADMHKSSPKHIKLTTFTACFKGWAVGCDTLHLTSELSTKFSIHVVPMLQRQVCSNIKNGPVSERYSRSGLTANVRNRPLIE